MRKMVDLIWNKLNPHPIRRRMDWIWIELNPHDPEMYGLDLD